ncbi:STAS domain-containing protein [Streptomyces sp. SID486]|uniref:STAS domain-containing protein n=1 Tax=Streptomyces sp. SID486 TaxID=2690264 RepID=UPI001F43A698|nr:STAS domain-containing protein [Streptomyces sp. SID486]
METGQPSPPARVRPGGPAPLLLRTAREHRPGLGGVSVLAARGTVDACNAGRFTEALADHLERTGQAGDHAVLDLTEVYIACSAADLLHRGTGGGCTRSGRALSVVQPRPHVRETLTAAGLPGVRLHACLDAALLALAARGPVRAEPGTHDQDR